MDSALLAFASMAVAFASVTGAFALSAAITLSLLRKEIRRMQSRLNALEQTPAGKS